MTVYDSKDEMVEAQLEQFKLEAAEALKPIQELIALKRSDFDVKILCHFYIEAAGKAYTVGVKKDGTLI